MKRLISSLLTMVMLFSISSPALAVDFMNDFSDGTYEIQEIEDGDIFICLGAEKKLTILTGETDHLIDVSIEYADQPNLVYHWRMDDYPVSAFEPDDSSFWLDIVRYVEADMDSAETIQFTETIYDGDSPTAYSSGARDLKEQLVSLYGNDYSNVLKYTANYKGENFKIYEKLENRAELAVSKSWSSSLYIGSIITSILHGQINTALTNIIAKIFNVPASIYSVVTAGSIDKYACRAFLSRHVKYSLQGTTQGNGLTGADMPVRFSM